MKRLLGNISYRVKVPLAFTAAILGAGLLVAAVLIVRAKDDFRADLIRNANDVGRVLAAQLVPALRHDDLWSAYQTIQALRGSELERQRLLLVLGEDGLVYVSNQPQDFPVQSHPASGDQELNQLSEALAEAISEPLIIERDGLKRLYLLIPLVHDGVRLGHLVMGYPHSLIFPRLLDIYWRVTWSSALALALLVPVGWLIGQRMTKPLTRLAACMGQVGRQPAADIQCQLTPGNDEIGLLGSQFQKMLIDLAEKERLEQEVLASERLAAVGRVAAGVAHEINNPLGGLLNALNTFRRFHQTDPQADRTISLLERGLGQIKETVAALLVQAKPEMHPLSADDIEDVQRLLEPAAQRQGVGVRIHRMIGTQIALPSTPVRQILINLTLNAIQASPKGAVVDCRIAEDDGLFTMIVDNHGETIPSERMGELFEPFITTGAKGGESSGLGLWVTYQLVNQLRGEITVSSEDGMNRFSVILPLQDIAA